MKFEKSCGVIIFTREENQIKYIIIQSINGIYGFPKGHVEGSETEIETALREASEEVGLMPNILDGFRETVEYYIPSSDINKRVVYFVGECANQNIVYQKEELLSAELMCFEEAIKCFTHENNKELLIKAEAFIKSL